MKIVTSITSRTSGMPIPAFKIKLSKIRKFFGLRYIKCGYIRKSLKKYCYGEGWFYENEVAGIKEDGSIV